MSGTDVSIPDGLMVEFLQGRNVEGITTRVPNFGWIVHSPQLNDSQTAYRVLVASELNLLQQNQTDLWDSQRCDSKDSINVTYQGNVLQSYSSYYWKVKTWCKLGGESGWSDVMVFRTGEISQKYSTARYPLSQTAIAPVKITKKSRRRYLIDFGKVAFGYVRLELRAHHNGHKLKVHLAERGDANGVNKKPGKNIRYYKIKQTLRKGVNNIDIRPPKNQRNTKGKAIKLPKQIGVISPFRYVELDNCPEELTESMIWQISVHYPFNDSASFFSSSDQVLNEIWALCKYSMKATSYCGIYVDGDRERLPYEADAYINQLSHYAVDREFTLARYSHEHLLNHPTWPTEWKHHSVMMAWQDYMYTGNTKSLTENYRVIKLKTLGKLARADGLLNTKGLRDNVDWPPGERDGYEFKHVNTVINAFYYLTLLQMVDIAAALGKNAEVEEFRRKAAIVKTSFNTALFDTRRGIYIDGEGATHASLHANMIPLAFGLVPEDRIEKVTDFVVSKGMACSVYAAQYLLESLYVGGRSEVALERILSKDIRSWYNMLRVGSTITLEAWDNKFKPNQDWNHAWGAVPGNIIPRYLMGIRPLEPGFKKVLIQPQPAFLEEASIMVPTIRGPISMSFRNEPGKDFILNVDIPVNVVAQVRFPHFNHQSTTLEIDGKIVSAEITEKFLVVDGIGSGRHIVTFPGK